MARKKVKTIACWEDLINWISSMNPYENTLVLSGWINHVNKEGKTSIDSLIFNMVSIDILLDVHQDKYSSDKKKKKKK